MDKQEAGLKLATVRETCWRAARQTEERTSNRRVLTLALPSRDGERERTAVPLLPARGLSASSAVPPPMINARARFAQASPEANCKHPEGSNALRLHARPPSPLPLSR